MKKKPNITLGVYRTQDLEAIMDIFYSAVHALDTALYTPSEKQAWAPHAMDAEYWASRLAKKQPWCAYIDGHCVGFMELDPDGHIDCTYVHPKAQGQGIASMLYQNLETAARQQGLEELRVEASKAALAVFQHWGFTCKHTNEISRHGDILINYTMTKCLK